MRNTSAFLVSEAILFARRARWVNSASMAGQLFNQAPDQDFALADAANWVVALLNGSVGTTIALLAIAGVGFAMLQGRLSARDGLRVVVGCCIMFGAPAIAQGLSGILRWGSGPIAIPAPPPPPKLTPPKSKPNADTYAGASMPM